MHTWLNDVRSGETRDSIVDAVMVALYSLRGSGRCGRWSWRNDAVLKLSRDYPALFINLNDTFLGDLIIFLHPHSHNGRKRKKDDD